MNTLKIHFAFFCFSIMILFSYSKACAQKSNLTGERPNILWITSEDNSTHLGCYGDPVASTPNIDGLAEKGVRYMNCFANAPVCAPARSSWILGMPAISTGTFQMRSWYRVPDSLQPYPVLLKEAGYYVSNNSKTDYNTSSFDKEIWDECGTEAHYRNRAEGQPFFAVFNLLHSHEGQIFEYLYPEKYPEAKTSADRIEIPPYQVKTQEVVRDWQRVYDRISDMDKAVGKLLKELEESGEADNTIIFYNSDHGGITLRTKRYLYDSGTRVPFIVYVPEKWKKLLAADPGSVIHRLTQFIDMPKTFLSLAEAKVPGRMPGKIIMGDSKEKAPESLLLFSGRFDEAPDMSRAITDGRWKYIRNYEPDRPRYQMLQYPWNQSGQVSQYHEYRAGKTNVIQSAHYLPQPPEELYDTQNDPDEIHNLVKDKKYFSRLLLMREKMDEKLMEAQDLGFIPEPIMARVDRNKSTTIYEFGQSEMNYPLEDIIKIANLAFMQNPENIPVLKMNLQNENPIIRYWAILGLRVLGKDARPALFAIEEVLKDPEPSVRINAAICLGNLDYREKAVSLLIAESRQADTDAHANWALDGIKYLGEAGSIENIPKEELVKGNYSERTYNHLMMNGTMYLPKNEE